jgi:hypothetical protein
MVLERRSLAKPEPTIVMSEPPARPPVNGEIEDTLIGYESLNEPVTLEYLAKPRPFPTSTRRSYDPAGAARTVQVNAVVVAAVTLQKEVFK